MTAQPVKGANPSDHQLESGGQVSSVEDARHKQKRIRRSKKLVFHLRSQVHSTHERIIVVISHENDHACMHT